MARFQKNPSAPLGTVTVTVASGTFVLTDEEVLEVRDGDAIIVFLNHPYVILEGGLYDPVDAYYTPQPVYINARPSDGDVPVYGDSAWEPEAGGSGGGVGPEGPAGPTGPTGATGATGRDGVGVPAGGSTGQVLAKTSGTDYDTRWSDPSGGGLTDGSVSDRHIAAGAAIAESKLALASDAAAGTASRRSLGTSATSAAAGDDARLSDSRAPRGTAGGILGGTYPNPTLNIARNGGLATFGGGTSVGVALGTGTGEAAPGVSAVGRVAHGATAGTARPTGYAMIIWVGSVDPTNRVTGDLWVRTA